MPHVQSHWLNYTTTSIVKFFTRKRSSLHPCGHPHKKTEARIILKIRFDIECEKVIVKIFLKIFVFRIITFLKLYSFIRNSYFLCGYLSKMSIFPIIFEALTKFRRQNDKFRSLRDNNNDMTSQSCDTIIKNINYRIDKRKLKTF